MHAAVAYEKWSTFFTCSLLFCISKRIVRALCIRSISAQACVSPRENHCSRFLFISKRARCGICFDFSLVLSVSHSLAVIFHSSFLWINIVLATANADFVHFKAIWNALVVQCWMCFASCALGSQLNCIESERNYKSSLNIINVNMCNLCYSVLT